MSDPEVKSMTELEEGGTCFWVMAQCRCTLYCHHPETGSTLALNCCGNLKNLKLEKFSFSV
jgi:hypothetical protein